MGKDMNSTGLHIKQAGPADAPAIIAIWNPLIAASEVTFNSIERSEADIVSMIRTRSEKGFPFLVARTPEVAGFVTFDQFRTGSGYRRTMEHTIIVSRGSRSIGVGRALMTAVERVAGDCGVHSLIGGISSANQPAIDFHTALGFAIIGRLPEVGCKFGRYFDLVLMQKFISR